jgi:hypothetical protein
MVAASAPVAATKANAIPGAAPTESVSQPTSGGLVALPMANAL